VLAACLSVPVDATAERRGLPYEVAKRTAFDLRASLHHLSNAYLGESNRGLNAILLTLGFSAHH
jgi:hypothetical protein